MRRIVLLFSLLTGAFCVNAQFADCFTHADACTDPTFTVSPNGSGTVDELAGNNISNPGTNPNPVPGNAGCLLAGELNSTWMVINVTGGGVLEWSVGSPVTSPGCIDWAMWPYDATACADIASNSLPPVACNWNGACNGITGMANPGNIPAGGSPFDFETPLNVNAGDQFVVCISNFSSQTTNFPLDFFGTAQVSCGTVDVTICLGDTALISADAVPGATYTWQPDPTLWTDANGDTAWANPTVTTDYYLTIDDGNGGIIEDTATVTVIPQVTVDSIVIDTATCLTPPNGSIDIFWNSTFNPNIFDLSGTSTASNNTGTFTGLAGGPYTIIMYPDGFPQCADTLDTTVVYTPLPPVTFGGDPVECEGSNSFLWATGGASYTWSDGSTNDTLFLNNMSDTAMITVSVDNGCQIVDTTWNVMAIPFLYPDSITVVDAYCLTPPDGELTVNMPGWIPPSTYIIGGAINDTTNNPTYTGVGDGYYTVTIYPNGYPECAVTVDTTVAYIPVQQPEYFGDTIVCIGDQTTLWFTGGLDYVWDNGNPDNDITVFALDTSSYSVDVDNGCFFETHVWTVYAVPFPNASAGNDTTVSVETELQLGATGGEQYFWSPATGLSCSNCPDPIFYANDDATYTVTVVDSNGCRSVDFINIKVEFLDLFIPSAFSPNDDGVNDILYLRGYGIKNVNFNVYDRWGNQVFHSTDKANGWDGTYQGRDLPPGAYAYLVTVIRNNGDYEEFKGNVTLYR